MFDGIGIQFISKQTYYSTLTKLCYPVIWAFWLIHQSQILQEMRVKKIWTTKKFLITTSQDLESSGVAINLAGDGRFNSPGLCNPCPCPCRRDVGTTDSSGIHIGCTQAPLAIPPIPISPSLLTCIG